MTTCLVVRQTLTATVLHSPDSIRLGAFVCVCEDINSAKFEAIASEESDQLGGKTHPVISYYFSEYESGLNAPPLRLTSLGSMLHPCDSPHLAQCSTPATHLTWLNAPPLRLTSKPQPMFTIYASDDELCKPQVLVEGRIFKTYLGVKMPIPLI
jgi:hypothetical protein